MYSVHNRFIDITFCVLFSGIFMDITQLYIRAFSWEPLYTIFGIYIGLIIFEFVVKMTNEISGKDLLPGTY